MLICARHHHAAVASKDHERQRDGAEDERIGTDLEDEEGCGDQWIDEESAATIHWKGEPSAIFEGSAAGAASAMVMPACP